jgi:hypothetical protein
MKQLLPSVFRNSSDGSFSQSVLEMGINPTVGESLLPCGTVVDEGIVGEAAVVGVVVLNIDKMVGGELFEGEFGLDGFIA